MTIAPCPKCHEPVRIPPSASHQASVRCPLCLDEFLLAEVFESLPPLLQVTEDPGECIASDESPVSAGVFGLVSPDANDGVELAPAFSIDRSRDVSAVASTPSTKRRRGPVRPQTRKKNPTVEVVKVVLGGVAGLVIAQVLLWWMPWQNLRRDPFALGPSIAKHAPWLVPARFHGSLSTNASSVRGDSATENEFDAANTADLSASGLPQRDFGDLDDSAKLTADPFAPSAELPPSVEPAELGDDLFEIHPPMDLSGDLETDPILDIESDPLPAGLAPEPTPTPQPAPVDKVRRLKSAPQFRPDELTAALTEVQPTFEALSAADADDAVNLVREAYANLTALAEMVAGGQELEQLDRQLAARLLLSLGEKPDVISWLDRAGTTWLRAAERRSNNGILLVCEVQAVGAQGDLYRTQLMLSDGKTVASYSDTDPAEILQSGERVLLVGVIVDQPASHLSGYTGQEQTVIWGPFFQVVQE